MVPKFTSVSRERVARRFFSARARRTKRHDLAHGPRCEGDQVAGRQAVGGAIGIARHRPQGVGRHDIGGRRGDQSSLGDPAPLALFGHAGEPAFLERAQVVIHLLPRQSDPLGQGRGRARLGQLGEDPSPERVHQRGGRGGILDGFDVQHGGMRALTRDFVKAPNTSHCCPLDAPKSPSQDVGRLL